MKQNTANVESMYKTISQGILTGTIDVEGLTTFSDSNKIYYQYEMVPTPAGRDRCRQ